MKPTIDGSRGHAILAVGIDRCETRGANALYGISLSDSIWLLFSVLQELGFFFMWHKIAWTVDADLHFLKNTYQ